VVLGYPPDDPRLQPPASLTPRQVTCNDRTVHPFIEPFESGALEVDDGQSVYWEIVGATNGMPALFMHGGPGSGATVGARRYFDPDAFRAVLFDQRGCGRSRPLADVPDVDLTVNTTGHLLSDVEALRRHLCIDRWLLVGVSWGSTLALVYAQRHPDRVGGMVLGAVTSGTRRETTWITREMARVFPREWDELVELVPEDERGGDLAAAYARLLAHPDDGIRTEAARRWCAWEDTHVSLAPGWTHQSRYDDPSFRAVFARLVTHYWSHGCFLDDDQVLDNMDRIADIPAVLVHGRRDISGPLETPWRLHLRWPASRLVVLDDAGHGTGSFGAEMVTAIDSMRKP
jgi:proline iminopeptidase